jgi:hypothetical protein
MKISPGSKAKIVDEIGFVLEKMKNEADPAGKLYYFSAVYGVMNRIFNLEYSSDLVFAHYILQGVHNQISARLQSQERAFQLPPEVFEKLTEATAELLEAIEKGLNLYEVLKRFSLIGYVSVGNGYYLYQRGVLKL